MRIPQGAPVLFDEHYRKCEVADPVGRSMRAIRDFAEIGLGPSSGRTEGGFRSRSEVDHLLVQGES